MSARAEENEEAGRLAKVHVTALRAHQIAPLFQDNCRAGEGKYSHLIGQNI